MSDDAASAKARGVTAFKAKDFDTAIAEFSKAIELAPSDHTLYGNLSASYYNQNKFQEALDSAEKCIEVKPDWGKGYQRKGLALQGLKKNDDAKAAFEKGLEIDPSNTQIKDALAKLSQPAPEENPFFSAEAMGKLMANPKTRAYFDDVDFKNKFEFCKSNPQMMMQLLQTDPRFMDVFSTITGLDLGKMQEEQSKNRENMEELKKKREEEEKQKQAEEEERARKEAEEALPPEEKDRLDRHKSADEQKDLGNASYKKRDFEAAIEHYDKAIELYPEDITYYTNKAAVYFQMKEFEKCIELCDQAAEVCESKDKEFDDFKKLSKAYARKANALSKLNNFDESIAFYKKALLEHNDFAYKDAMKKVEKEKKKAEDLAYIDPEKSEAHREAGNDLFKAHDFPAAIKEYDEGLRRDPSNVKIYSNRAYAYIKLNEYPTAQKDIEKGLELDPTFVKLWIRKGGVHFLMKEYHKAMEAYDTGLKHDPTNQELIEGKQKTIMAISAGARQGGENEEERMKHAMADPEIQALVKDLRVQQLLKDMQENPMAAQEKMQDPFLSEAINKLVAAGVLKFK